MKYLTCCNDIDRCVFFNIFTEDWMIPFAFFAQGLTKIGNNQFSIDLPKGFSWNESLSGHVVFKHV